MVHYNWDLDKQDGEFAEELLATIFSSEFGRVEVKRDFRVSETGNIAVEFRCRGKSSGIATTEADWWAFVLDGPKYNHKVILIIGTLRLRTMTEYFYKEDGWVPGGDDGLSEMVLIPVTRLLAWTPPSLAPALLRVKK